VETIDDTDLAYVVGGVWGISAQGRTPLPGGGNAQGGFRFGGDGIGFGFQGQTPLPWGGHAQMDFRLGNYPMPSLPPPPQPSGGQSN
jgi:hypothetical protein